MCDKTTAKLLRLADIMAGIAAQVSGECYKRRRDEKPSAMTIKRDMLRAAVDNYTAAREAADGVYFSREGSGADTHADPTAQTGIDDATEGQPQADRRSARVHLEVETGAEAVPDCSSALREVQRRGEDRAGYSGRSHSATSR